MSDIVTVWDNGGETNDRYTVLIDNSIYGMNTMPFHPTYGFSQYCGEKEPDNDLSHCGRIVCELPKDVLQAIVQRIE